MTVTDSIEEAVKTAWLVIEAIPERLSIKQDVFAALEKYAPEDAILASNSSSFKSREIAEHLHSAYRGEPVCTQVKEYMLIYCNLFSLQYALFQSARKVGDLLLHFYAVLLTGNPREQSLP